MTKRIEVRFVLTTNRTVAEIGSAVTQYLVDETEAVEGLCIGPHDSIIQEPDSRWLSSPLSTFPGMPTRAITSLSTVHLRSAGGVYRRREELDIKTVGDLLKLSAWNLNQVCHIGETTIGQIRNALRVENLFLAGEDKDPPGTSD